MNITEPAGIDLAALRALVNSSPHEERNKILPDGKFPAISYLWVSAKGQAARNGLAEGLPIPTQREAADRKAEQLNAVIIAEFIEPGESANSAHRKALQEMLDYIGAHEVKYCIINKVDRLARNRLDDEEQVIIEATKPVATILDTAAKTKNGNARTPSALKRGKVRTLPITWS